MRERKGAMRVFLASCMVLVLLGGAVPSARAETSLNDLQSQINNLLQVIAQLQAQLGQNSTHHEMTHSCVSITRALYIGQSDRETGGEVTLLQRYLGMNPTGFFGPLTEGKVKAWQAQHGIVSSGDPDTTGYGLVGQRTRALMNRCDDTSSVARPDVATDSSAPSCTIRTSNPNPKVGESFTISWTTKNIQNPVFVEGTKGGGSYSVAAQGSHKFAELGVYGPMFGIGDGFGEDKVVCSMSVAVGGESSLKTPVIQFSASDVNVRPGQNIKLSWNVQDAQRCTLQYTTNKITNEVGGISTHDSIVDAPVGDTTYRLWCANDSGAGKDGPSAEKTIKIYMAEPSCSIKVSEFIPSPYTSVPGAIYVKPNTSATITWAAKNADYAVLNSDKVDLIGSVNTGMLSASDPLYVYSLMLYEDSELVEQCSTQIHVDQKG